MTLLFAFPEPLPLDRARGVQVAHVVTGLAQLGVKVELAYVPNPPLHPITHYGLTAPDGLILTPVSRSLPWPLQRVHSNRFFVSRLAGRIEAAADAILFVRHLKLAALLLHRYPGKGLVYEAHEVFSDTGTPERRAANFELEALVMRKAALVIANSVATAARLRELHGARRVEMLVNGVDWPESVPEKNWGDAGLHIVYAGSLFGWKGVEDLVSAASGLPGGRITIIGGTPQQIARLQQGAPKSGAQLVFLGQLAHTQVATALQSACIAVLPNRDDPDSRFTSPIKLFEYMAAGCAVVASDLPSLRDVLTDEEAVWTPAGDAAGLAAGIRTLTADPERARRLGARLRNKARAFTWRARAEKLASLLAELESPP